MFESIVKSLLGIAIILGSLYAGTFVLSGMPVYKSIIHVASLVLVLGALFGVSLLLIEFRDLGRFLQFIFGYHLANEKSKSLVSETNFEEMLNTYVEKGPHAFTAYVKQQNLPTIWQVVATKLEIKVPIKDIKQILGYKIRSVVSRLDQDGTTLRQLSTLAPGMGLLGTVLGLIKLLADMSDFGQIGGHMSLALMATLYGIFCGNVIFVPLARQVEKRKILTIKNHENIMYWLSTLEENKPSFYLKPQLRDLAEK